MEPPEIHISIKNIQGYDDLRLSVFPGSQISEIITAIASHLSLSPNQIDLGSGHILPVFSINSQLPNVDKIRSTSYYYFVKPLPTQIVSTLPRLTPSIESSSQFSPEKQDLDNLLNLPAEMLEQNILQMEPSIVVNLCRSSTAIDERCGDRVWKLLYYRDFGQNLLFPAKTWQEAYKLIYLYGKGYKISCGSNHVGMITKEGKLYMWGLNSSGQLGDGSREKKKIPTYIPFTSRVIRISCGSDYTGAITEDGQLYMWGDNIFGQLGVGTREDKYSPTHIPFSSRIIQISCGDSHTGAITEDGQLYMCGSNFGDQLGDGTTVIKNILTHIPFTYKVVRISCGSDYTGAITEDGQLYMWGNNVSGQLGDGTDVNKNIPTHIHFTSNIVRISCGSFHTGAITEGGQLYMWGSNSSGELGDGTRKYRDVPTHIPFNSSNVSQISCGPVYTGAITDDGKLYMWGSNGSGQLGDGTRVDKVFPAHIHFTSSKVIQISCGNGYTGAITENRKLYMWGYNSNGQLGDGKIINKNYPTLIMEGI